MTQRGPKVVILRWVQTIKILAFGHIPKGSWHSFFFLIVVNFRCVIWGLHSKSSSSTCYLHFWSWPWVILMYSETCTAQTSKITWNLHSYLTICQFCLLPCKTTYSKCKTTDKFLVCRYWPIRQILWTVCVCISQTVFYCVYMRVSVCHDFISKYTVCMHPLPKCVMWTDLWDCLWSVCADMMILCMLTQQLSYPDTDECQNMDLCAEYLSPAAFAHH